MTTCLIHLPLQELVSSRKDSKCGRDDLIPAGSCAFAAKLSPVLLQFRRNYHWLEQRGVHSSTFTHRRLSKKWFVGTTKRAYKGSAKSPKKLWREWRNTEQILPC